MNTNTPPTPDDDLPDERELAALYARLPKAEPDTSLDAVVLARASRAPARFLSPLKRLLRAERGVRSGRAPRWPLAIGSAAVLVLAVGVAWQVREAQPERAATLPAPSFRPAPAAATEHVAAPAPMAAAEAPAEPPAQAVPESSTPPHRAKRVAQNQVMQRILPVPAAPVVASAPMAPPAPPVPAAPPAPREPDAAMSGLIAPSSDAGLTGKARYLPKADLERDMGPDDRVGEIRGLLDSGQREDALRRLHDLRERYPHYDLPQDLRDLTP